MNLFYKQVVFSRSIPFSLNIPNAETVKALKDAKARRNLVYIESHEALVREIMANAADKHA